MQENNQTLSRPFTADNCLSFKQALNIKCTLIYLGALPAESQTVIGCCLESEFVILAVQCFTGNNNFPNGRWQKCRLWKRKEGRQGRHLYALLNYQFFIVCFGKRRRRGT